MFSGCHGNAAVGMHLIRKQMSTSMLCKFQSGSVPMQREWGMILFHIILGQVHDYCYVVVDYLQPFGATNQKRNPQINTNVTLLKHYIVCDLAKSGSRMKRKDNSSQKVTDFVSGVWLGWQGYPLVSGWVKKKSPLSAFKQNTNTFIYAIMSIDVITPWLSQNGYRVGARVTCFQVMLSYN